MKWPWISKRRELREARNNLRAVEWYLNRMRQGSRKDMWNTCRAHGAVIVFDGPEFYDRESLMEIVALIAQEEIEKFFKKYPKKTKAR
jgi:hypothetical protein